MKLRQSFNILLRICFKRSSHKHRKKDIFMWLILPTIEDNMQNLHRQQHAEEFFRDYFLCWRDIFVLLHVQSEVLWSFLLRLLAFLRERDHSDTQSWPIWMNVKMINDRMIRKASNGNWDWDSQETPLWAKKYFFFYKKSMLPVG